MPFWINAGVYVLSRKSFDQFPNKGDHEVTVFPDFAAERELIGYHSNAYWRAVDSVKDLSLAEKESGEWLNSKA